MAKETEREEIKEETHELEDEEDEEDEDDEDIDDDEVWNEIAFKIIQFYPVLIAVVKRKPILLVDESDDSTKAIDFFKRSGSDRRIWYQFEEL